MTAPAGPVPPPASRQDAIGQLLVERWHAESAGETGRVAEIDRQVQTLSAAAAGTNPARETAAAAPARPRTARTQISKPPKGNRRRDTGR